MIKTGRVRTAIKSIKSKYKGVSGITQSGYTYWRAYSCKTYKNGYKSEKAAAKAVDLILIANFKEPVNILVRK